MSGAWLIKIKKQAGRGLSESGHWSGQSRERSNHLLFFPARERIHPPRPVVPQTSKSAVSRVSKPANRPTTRNAPARCTRPERRGPADLEIGDTAGLETCATGTRGQLVYRGLPSLLYRGFPNPQTALPLGTPVLAARARNLAATADLEIGDTAGLETCTTWQPAGDSRTTDITSHSPRLLRATFASPISPLPIPLRQIPRPTRLNSRSEAFPSSLPPCALPISAVLRSARSPHSLAATNFPSRPR